MKSLQIGREYSNIKYSNETDAGLPASLLRGSTLSLSLSRSTASLPAAITPSHSPAPSPSSTVNGTSAPTHTHWPAHTTHLPRPPEDIPKQIYTNVPLKERKVSPTTMWARRYPALHPHLRRCLGKRDPTPPYKMAETVMMTLLLLPPFHLRLAVVSNKHCYHCNTVRPIYLTIEVGFEMLTRWPP
ncbi:uncharacterized protein LOC120355270 [Nilaparvata lugens]|uniref:uncharacterized protein LOC120355270 n=1 Tax=Nilaparvata lugens TaxID=108931 RepID=UPI00193D9E9E|nr:uncharacterized protein LOC120355270 [Nilaparvata lugens]XP_039299551.1 uncharacterized protein LOC120355270 [Nilaparvata lugens]